MLNSVLVLWDLAFCKWSGCKEPNVAQREDLATGTTIQVKAPAAVVSNQIKDRHRGL